MLNVNEDKDDEDEDDEDEDYNPEYNSDCRLIPAIKGSKAKDNAINDKKLVYMNLMRSLFSCIMVDKG